MLKRSLTTIRKITASNSIRKIRASNSEMFIRQMQTPAVSNDRLLQSFRNRNPLVELRKTFYDKGICDQKGYRNPGAPWAFQLAESNPNLSVRTVGFQRVSEEGIDYLVKHSAPELPREVAFCVVEGIYPPPPGEVCDQWRGEGKVVQLPVQSVLSTAPIGSFAQILVCAQNFGTGGNGGAQGARPSLADRDALVGEVQDMKSKLENKEVNLSDIEQAILVCRIIPTRIELLRSGPIWERFEWESNRADSMELEWSNAQRLVPY